jgi:DNA-binding CsgD family transcriptional regulator/sugar-specific transcriptional regulator TrmB
VLAPLGLDGWAEALYRWMLACPAEDLATARDHIGASEQELGAAVARLVELGLVRTSTQHAGRLRAVSPEVGMELLLTRQQAELAQQQHRIETARAAAAELIAEYTDLRSATQPQVERLVGVDVIRDRLSALASDLREEVASFVLRPMSRAAMAASRSHDQSVLARGVRMLDIHLDSVRNDPHNLAYLHWLADSGAQVRTVPSLPTRMIIFDRERVLIPVRTDDTASAAVILTGQGTIAGLYALFESVWAAARPLRQPPTRNVLGLTPHEAAILRLLALGHTDEAIANRLAVSPRTARRTASDLMERLGARSRFQAGVRAVQQGWIPAADTNLD